MTPEAETTREAINGAPIYEVPESNLPKLQERVAKLNRRALKLGMLPLVLTEHGEKFKTFDRDITKYSDEGERYTTTVKEIKRLTPCIAHAKLQEYSGGAQKARAMDHFKNIRPEQETRDLKRV